MAKLFGPDGKPLPAARVPKPETREIAVASIRDKWSTYPSSGLTPAKLATIFREADAGDVYRQAELFEEIEEKDTHLGSILQTRKLAVMGTDWEVQPFDADTPEDVQVAEWVKGALDRISGFEDVELDLLDAIGKGYSAAELHWAIRVGQAVVERMKWVQPKRFRFGDLDELRLLTEESPALGVELPENKFVVHRYKARSGHPSRAGLLRTCAWMYLFKNYSVKDWVAFAEIYGMPLRLGKYKSGIGEEDKRALMQALVMLGTDAAGIISDNTEIEFKEAVRNAGGDIFEGLATFCNSEMSKAVLGQTLTTEIGDRGSYGASKTHQKVRQDLLEADCKALAETLRQGLIRPLVLFNFGPAVVSRLPWLKFAYEPPEDRQAGAQTYKTLITEIGLPVAQEHLYEKFGVPKPEPGQELVVPPILAAAPGEPALATNRLPASDAQLLALAGRRRVPRAPVENLADAALLRALPLIAGLAAPIRELILSAGSLEEIQEKLPGLYERMDTRDLEELLQRVLFTADLYGRWTVMQHG